MPGLKIDRFHLTISFASLLLIPTIKAHAFDFTQISFESSIDVKGEFATNETDFSDAAKDDRNAAHLNIMLGLSGEPIEGIKARVEAYREPITEADPPASQTQYGQAMQGSGSELGNFALENLYIHFEDLFLGVQARFGWQYMGDDLDLVSYTGHYNDDSLTITHADSAWLKRQFGPVTATIFQAVTRDVPSLLTDTDFTLNSVALTTGTSASRWYVKKIGLSTQIQDLLGEQAPSMNIGLNLHQGQDRGAATVADNTNLFVYELTARGHLKRCELQYFATYAQNSGRRNVLLNSGSSGTNFKGRLWHIGGNLSLSNTLKFSGQMAQSTGDNNPAEPSDASPSEESDKSFHDLGSLGMAPKIAFGEILGQSNTLTGGRPLLQGLESGNPLIGGGQGRGFEVLSAGFRYSLPQTPTTSLSLNYILAFSQTLQDATDSGKNRKIGDEINVAVHYKKFENVTLKLALAALKPALNSAALGNGNSADLVRKIVAGATMNF